MKQRRMLISKYGRKTVCNRRLKATDTKRT